MQISHFFFYWANGDFIRVLTKLRKMLRNGYLEANIKQGKILYICIFASNWIFECYINCVNYV